jgi:hypothetical protein
MRLVRLAVQAVLFFLLLGVVMGIAADETGVAEKIVLAAMGAGLIWLAAQVRRIGPHGPHST